MMKPQHFFLITSILYAHLPTGNQDTAYVSAFSVGSITTSIKRKQQFSGHVQVPILPRDTTTSTSLCYTVNKEHHHSLLQTKRMQEAELVERTLSNSLHEARITHYTNKRSTVPLFPSVRQCNAAIATFGDSGDFRRALKMFTEMRKSASILRRILSSSGNLFSTMDKTNESSSLEWEENVELNDGGGMSAYLDLVEEAPVPTLVTYSTLISRAVGVGKPRVAIRLWNLMKNQPTFYTNVISRKMRQGRISDFEVFMDPIELKRLEVEHDAIVPDAIFCNTLMNAYAKLGDHLMARFILNSMLRSSGKDAKDGIVLHEIPQVKPTIVTFNTLADACKEAGDLAAGLEVLELMKSYNQQPDARTYTILISTVARKPKHTQVKNVNSGGESDPDRAFELLYEMQEKGIKPNGVTFSALIDVCGRCRRADLALNGLRIMLSQKKAENNTKPLVNEVGAWTAAITACGKYGRIDTALRLFDAMQRQFQVKPNVVTCGALTDSLVKAGRVSETIQILQYMKSEGIVPGEVMYTSLMSSALELAKRKNDEILTVDGLQVKVIDRLVNDVDKEESRNATENSIMLYSELMRSMVTGNMEAGERRETVLMRIFLAFGEMKGAGITPDVACYNSLLRACSFAGDAARAYSVLMKMNEDGLQPNDSSYRYVLRAAVKDGRSDVADIVWNDATTRKQSPYDYSFSPRAADFELLVNTYWCEIGKTTNHTARMSGYRKILDAYECVQLQSGDRGMYRISLSEIEQNQHLMLTVLRSAVSVVLVPRKEETPDDIRERVRARSMAVEIAGLEVMRGALSSSYVDGKMKKALGLATEWMHVN